MGADRSPCLSDSEHESVRMTRIKRGVFTQEDVVALCTRAGRSLTEPISVRLTLRRCQRLYPPRMAHHRDARRWRTILAALVGMAVSAPAIAYATDGTEATYLLHCSGCHRSDGTGVPGTTPDLHQLAPLLHSERGRAYLVRVPGVAQAPVDDGELARLLNWVLQRFSAVTPDPPFSAAEVGRLRVEPLRDPGSERRAIDRADRAGRD